MDRERYGEAGLAVEAARSRLGSNEPNPLLVAMEGRLHALQGQGARARILADSTRAFSPVLAASVYSILEDDGKALDLIEEGYREKDVYMTFLKVWPDADRLRDSPRFQQIMRDMKLD
jgi:hypothetical protein